MKKIVILGGGAAGLAAAVRASGHPEAEVTVLERQGRVGRKLLSTGNGRCNLTNTGASAADYCGMEGDAAAFAGQALRRFPPQAVMQAFASLGLKTREEYGGRVYPYSDQAGSVLDVLRLALEARGVTMITGAAAESIRALPGGGFRVEWEGGRLEAARVIVACGGCAGGKIGGVQDGYRLLKQLGHEITPLRPALAALRTAPEYPRALKGVRANALARLMINGREAARAEGDVLFTDTGLSGSAVFDLSLFYALRESERGTAAVTLCFFPGEKRESLITALENNAARWGKEEANRIFTGLLQSRLGLMLCKYAGIGGNRNAKALSREELARAADAAFSFSLPVEGSGGFESAQITVGGARTAEFDPETLESRLIPGLYACGEVLDVAAVCGGYNLQWAWASGLTAGEASCS